MKKGRKGKELKPVRMAHRTTYQTVLLGVIQELGFWEEYGIRTEMIKIDKTEEAETALLSGKIDLIIGNHTLPYRDRGKGMPVVYFAQTVNFVRETLLVQQDIKNFQDLKGRRIAITWPRQHPDLTIRLRLKEAGLDPDSDRITMVPVGTSDLNIRLDAVLKGKADAVFLNPPYDRIGERAGLRAIPMPNFPMVWGVTLTSTLPFLEADTERTLSLLKALVAGIAFFKTHPKETIEIIKRHGTGPEISGDRELLEHLYQSFQALLEKKPYPHPLAVYNVFQLVLMEYPGLANMSPMELWDTHYLRILDDSGFIDSLYSEKR